VKLFTHIHLALRLKMLGALPPSPPYVFMAQGQIYLTFASWRVTTV